MIPPRIRNKFSDHPQKITRPISVRLSEEMIGLLKETADEHGFKRIQGLIRLYIRQGLDRDHDGYTLADDEVFIEKLRANGVSASIIEKAIIDTHNRYETKGLLEEQLQPKPHIKPNSKNNPKNNSKNEK
ncbi:CopG family transcriptional regulator [Psychrobacter sp.]|uniref:CopG family transcriptional regulator n=1 Tax=Psychrobacter sp. TaxID=56811 RepID=UPI00344FB8A3